MTPLTIGSTSATNRTVKLYYSKWVFNAHNVECHMKDEKNLFDFGFTAVNVEELDVLQERDLEVERQRDAAAKAREEARVERERAEQGTMSLQARLDKLYESVQPLLTNLKKDADTKDYIYWENRKPRIEAFERLLKNIYEGKE